jgi:hypothetical protein
MLAALAVNAAFTARGRAATYTPPGGGASTPCLLIDDASDRQAAGTLGRPVMKGLVVKVRKSEIAAPAKDGTFVFTDTSESVKILSDPVTIDGARLVWDCTVR